MARLDRNKPVLSVIKGGKKSMPYTNVLLIINTVLIVWLYFKLYSGR